MKLRGAYQLPYKTAAAHLTCCLTSVGRVSWTDLSIPLSLSKPGNEGLWQARGGCGGSYIPFPLLPTHWKARQAWSDLKKKRHLILSSSRIHWQECLVSDRKARCYSGKQCCFPLWWENQLGFFFFFLHQVFFAVSCCWVHNLLTHRRYS